MNCPLCVCVCVCACLLVQGNPEGHPISDDPFLLRDGAGKGCNGARCIIQCFYFSTEKSWGVMFCVNWNCLDLACVGDDLVDTSGAMYGSLGNVYSALAANTPFKPQKKKKSPMPGANDGVGGWLCTT